MSHPDSRDDLLRLAFSLHTNPGAYALLVGAGASYTSGIPTAWGVLSDLCRRVAALHGHDVGTGDPAAWYERTFGAEPTYGSVLEWLAPTPALRQALLEEYFEVTADDIEAGRRLPTVAHHAIARLVTEGAVKVIVTLNFDRLIEQALREAHIEPTVITHPSEVAGMRPLHQLRCCVIHLHGDFKNPDSMLNTDTELAGYDPRTVKLLDRILEDYGLIVAGWSGTYDTALRAHIAERHNIGRYPLVWMEPHQVSGQSAHLLDLKRGMSLQVTADDGFGRLADAVNALRVRQGAHPLTVPVAVSVAKRELSGRSVAISTHDTLAQEFAHLHQHRDFQYSDVTEEADAGGFAAMMARIEEAVTVPAALVATLAYWADPATTSRWWLPELVRFSYRSEGSGSTRLLGVRRVAGLWLFYAAGVSAVAAGRWDLLNTMFRTEVPALWSFTSREKLNSFYEPALIFDTPEDDRGFYDRCSAVLLEALGLSPEALEEAWQTFELLRHSTRVAWRPDFEDALTELTSRDREVAATEEAYESLSAAGADTTDVQARRAAASQDASRAHGRVVRLIEYEHVHVLTADRVGPNVGHTVPLAARLANELEVQRDAHPLAQSALTAHWGALPVALRAVAAGFGFLGRDAAFRRVAPPGGSVPMTMWLDTGQTAEERGTRVVPS